MIELLQARHLFIDAPDVLLIFEFVEHFDRNLEVRVVHALREEHLAVRAVSELLSCGVDDVVLLKLVDALLLISLARYHIGTPDAFEIDEPLLADF